MDSSIKQKLQNYKPGQSVAKLVEETQILLLVGPTGAGKDSVKDKLLQTARYHHIISHTTRPPRINHGVIEHDGREYHFIDKAEAKKMLDDQSLIEAKIYSDNLYGTSVSEIQAAHDEGKIAMTDIEVQGVAEYKALDPNTMAIFLLPPDFKIWQDRLRRRYGDVVDVADYRLRLETAQKELEELLNTDYYVAVINNDLNKVVEQVETIVNSANHTSPDEPAARQVAQTLLEEIKNYLANSV